MFKVGKIIVLFATVKMNGVGARLYHLLLTLANLFKDHMMLLQQGQGICKHHPPHLARP